jgi:hypothetical protein
VQELGLVAFWAFVAVAVVAPIWREVAVRRETEVTVRLAIEKGQALDPALLDRLFRPRKSGPERLLVAGGVTLAAGVGLPILGYFLRLSGEAEAAAAFYPLIGVGILILLIGIALLIVSWLIRARPQTSEPLSR